LNWDRVTVRASVKQASPAMVKAVLSIGQVTEDDFRRIVSDKAQNVIRDKMRDDADAILRGLYLLVKDAAIGPADLDEDEVPFDHVIRKAFDAYVNEMRQKGTPLLLPEQMRFRNAINQARFNQRTARGFKYVELVIPVALAMLGIMMLPTKWGQSIISASTWQWIFSGWGTSVALPVGVLLVSLAVVVFIAWRYWNNPHRVLQQMYVQHGNKVLPPEVERLIREWGGRRLLMIGQQMNWSEESFELLETLSTLQGDFPPEALEYEDVLLLAVDRAGRIPEHGLSADDAERLRTAIKKAKFIEYNVRGNIPPEFRQIFELFAAQFKNGVEGSYRGGLGWCRLSVGLQGTPAMLNLWYDSVGKKPSYEIDVLLPQKLPVSHFERESKEEFLETAQEQIRRIVSYLRDSFPVGVIQPSGPQLDRQIDEIDIGFGNQFFDEGKNVFTANAEQQLRPMKNYRQTGRSKDLLRTLEALPYDKDLRRIVARELIAQRLALELNLDKTAILISEYLQKKEKNPRARVKGNVRRLLRIAHEKDVSDLTLIGAMAALFRADRLFELALADMDATQVDPHIPIRGYSGTSSRHLSDPTGQSLVEMVIGIIGGLTFIGATGIIITAETTNVPGAALVAGAGLLVAAWPYWKARRAEVIDNSIVRGGLGNAVNPGDTPIYSGVSPDIQEPEARTVAQTFRERLLSAA
jgi:hypothetical protein